MTLDNEQQRVVLLQLIEGATFPGHAIEVVYDLLVKVRAADVAPPTTDDGQSDG